jgi:hypothetical protein
MKEIKLTNGMAAAVDDEDFERANQYKWNLCATPTACFNGTSIQMANFVLGLPKSQRVDHINVNPLDNRKCNLRPCTAAQNTYNRKPNGKAFKGGNKKYDKDGNLHYYSMCNGGGYTWTLDGFETQDEAIRVYDSMAIQLQGEFAYLNFPEGYESILPDRLIENFRRAKLGVIKHPDEY